MPAFNTVVHHDLKLITESKRKTPCNIKIMLLVLG